MYSYHRQCFIAVVRNCVERSLPWWNIYIVTFIHDLVVFLVPSEICDLVMNFAWQDKRNFGSNLLCQLFRLLERSGSGVGAKTFWLLEPEPEIWVPVQWTKFVEQANFTNKTMVFSLNQIVLELEPKTFRSWSRRKKFRMPGAGVQNLSFGSAALVPTSDGFTHRPNRPWPRAPRF